MDYHADTAHDSHSSLQLFRASIEAYAAVRVHKTMPPRVPTPAMVLGSALHCRVLEEDEFAKRYIVAPGGLDRRKKDDKKAWEEFCQLAEGKTVITAEDADAIEGMYQGIMRNTFARRVIESDGEIEKAFYWADSMTGTPLKCKTDKICRSGIVADIKTTQDIRPDSWSKTVAAFNYHCQGSIYLQGTGAGPYLWIAVSKEPPYEAAVYALGAQSREIGDEENHETLIELSDRREANDWSGRWSTDLVEVDLPAWKVKQFLQRV